MPKDPVVVLVVDDEPLIRLSIAAELEDEGFVVFEAGTADEAIAVLELHAGISLVFTDVDMPGSMDGLKLAALFAIAGRQSKSLLLPATASLKSGSSPKVRPS